MKYKSEKVSLTKLVANIKPIPVYIPEGEVPEIKDRFGYILSNKNKINKLIIVTQVNQYDSYIGVTYCNYINFNGRVQTRLFPNDFEINVLTGKQASKLMDVFNNYEKENFHTKLNNKFYSGSDPEIFIQNNNTIVPAFSFLGTKEKPKHMVEQFSGQPSKKLYADGFAAEFETTPLACLSYHIDSIYQGLKTTYNAAKKLDTNNQLTIRNTFFIPNEIMDKASDNDIAFGCMPSLNVYNMKGKIVNPRELPFRFAGGHIHFGCGKQNDEVIVNGVKALDKVLAVACVSLFAKLDSTMRREYYGLAGEYRLPPHGLEYRVLSNAWLCHPLVTNLIFDLARKVLNFGMQGYGDLWKASEEEVIKVINTHDVAGAQEILKRNKEVFFKLLSVTYPGYNTELMYNVFINGVESIIQEPDNLEKNWCLNGVWRTHCSNMNASLNSAYDSISNNRKV